MKILYLVCFTSMLVWSGNKYSNSSIHLFTNSDSLKKNNHNNPVIPGDFADPSVIRVGNIYYATGTSSEWAPHFPIFKSTDLINWQQVGYVFNKKPSWTASSFWAPELFYHRGKFYVYYVARKAIDEISCIGVASADDPEKGFTDHGILLEFGKEAIDPFVIKDDQQLYITWKAYGLDDRPIELLGSKLSSDGLRLEGQPFTLLKDDARRGIEGQCLIKRNNSYYLFYSVGACCGRSCSYSVSVARANSIEGPYTDYERNPLLAENSQWKCHGHGTLVETNNDHWFYLYHAYRKTDHVYTGRQGLLDELKWSSEWPLFIKGIPSTSSDLNTIKNRKSTEVLSDNFNTTSIANFWQWDFRNSNPQVELEKGKLCLSGAVGVSGNKTGTVLTVRPYSGNYEMVAAVLNHNSALKGLAVYGDASESCGIGIKENTIQLWEVKKNKRIILKEISLSISDKPIRFKIKVEDGYKIAFFWSENSSTWTPLKTENTFYNGDFLPPWDRSPRPGLHHVGEDKDQACFSDFRITYAY